MRVRGKKLLLYLCFNSSEACLNGSENMVLIFILLFFQMFSGGREMVLEAMKLFWCCSIYNMSTRDFMILHNRYVLHSPLLYVTAICDNQYHISTRHMSFK